MKITVFLGANDTNDQALLKAVQDLGSWIGANGHELVYGGSKSGLMGVVAKAALIAHARVTGVEPKMFVDAGYVYDDISELIVTEDMAQRKSKMIEMGDAFVVFPGGTGTLEELAEVMSRQALRLIDKPCFIYNVDHYYDCLDELFNNMLDKGLATNNSFRGIYFVDDQKQIEEILRRCNKNNG